MNGKKNDMLILYVEDDAITREEMSHYLLRQAREVLTAKNGQEGLALFRERKPDLIVTDIAMPVMDGLQMAKAIRALDNGIPIILMTAHRDAGSVLDAHGMGGTHCVVKPVSMDDLSHAIGQCATHITSRRSAETGSA